jgi:DNA invertase Pin-like site-specific DNA recombinase
MSSQQMPRAVAYARTASRWKVDQEAIGAQLGAYRQVAHELGATLEDEFADHGISGLTLERPALRQLLAYVAANPVDYVICADRPRLVLQRHLGELVAASFVVAEAGLVLASAAPA